MVCPCLVSCFLRHLATIFQIPEISHRTETRNLELWTLVSVQKLMTCLSWIIFNCTQHASHKNRLRRLARGTTCFFLETLGAEVRPFVLLELSILSMGKRVKGFLGYSEVWYVNLQSSTVHSMFDIFVSGETIAMDTSAISRRFSCTHPVHWINKTISKCRRFLVQSLTPNIKQPPVGDETAWLGPF